MSVGGKKDPWWAVPVTILVIGAVAAPVILGVIWVCFKIWLSIAHMKGC